jgi:hypothetical protein
MEAAIRVEEKRLGGGRVSARPLLLALAVVLFLGLVYLGWWSLQPPSLQGFQLRTGARITLSAVTVGTIHEYDPAPPLHRLLRFLKPPQRIPEIGLETTGQPEVRLWLSYRPSVPNPSVDEYPIYHHFEDDHGCPLDVGKLGTVGRMYGGDMWTSWRPSDALRHDRAFDLCGYYRDTRAEAFRFHIEPRLRSSRRIPKQPLKPLPLPQTVVTKAVRATLVAVQDSRDPEPHCRAIVRGFDAKGAPISPVWVAATDQYGGRSEPMDADKRSKLAGVGLPFWGLCRKEPAWKLTATVAREPGTNTVPDVRWEFPRIAIGGKTATQRLGPRSLRVYALSERTAPGSKIRRVILWVQGNGYTTPCRLALTRVNGENSAEVVSAATKRGAVSRKPVLVTELTPGVRWRVAFTFPVPERPSVLNVEIGEFAGHRVEFVAAPPKVLN